MYLNGDDTAHLSDPIYGNEPMPTELPAPESSLMHPYLTDNIIFPINEVQACASVLSNLEEKHAAYAQEFGATKAFASSFVAAEDDGIHALFPDERFDTPILYVAVPGARKGQRKWEDIRLTASPHGSPSRIHLEFTSREKLIDEYHDEERYVDSPDWPWRNSQVLIIPLLHSTIFQAVIQAEQLKSLIIITQSPDGIEFSRIKGDWVWQNFYYKNSELFHQEKSIAEKSQAPREHVLSRKYLPSMSIADSWMQEERLEYGVFKKITYFANPLELLERDYPLE